MSILEKVSNTLGRIRGSYSKGLADVFHVTGAHPALTDDSAWNTSPFWGAGAQSGKPRSKQQLVEQFASWVFICARLNADARSAVPWGLYVEAAPAGEKWRTVETRAVKPARRKALAMRAELRPWITKTNEGDDIEEITEHPFLELMRRPNPWTSGTDLRWITSVFMDLTGEAYWYIVKDGLGVPRQLWVIPSQYLRPIPGASLDEFIVGYEYLRGKSNVIIPAADVVEFKYANPLNQLGGFAPILGIVDAVYVNSKMSEFTESMFENKARIGGVLESDSKISAPELERFRESWKQKYAGVAKSGATVILPPGLKYQRDFVTPDEMSYIEGKRITREEICVPPGTLIYSSSGLVPIESISVGDFVLTHGGQYHPVLKTFQRQYDGPLVTVKAKGLPSVSMTPNHPVLIIEAKQTRTHQSTFSSEHTWKRADTIIPRKAQSDGAYSRLAYDCACLPKIKPGKLDLIDLANYSDNLNLTLTRNLISKNNPNSIPTWRYLRLTEDFGRLIGYFISEGSTGDHQTLFYFHQDESAYIEEVGALLRTYFGVDSSVFEKPEYSIKCVRCSNKIVSDFFRQFGHKSHEKIIPKWCFDGPLEFWRGILAGCLNGDGYTRKDGSRRRITSTSLTLVWQLRLILASLGNNSSISKREAVNRKCEAIGDREIYSRDSYDVQWNGGSENSSINIDGDYIKCFIETAETDKYSGLVFNLEVEEDNSYVTMGGIVHNCAGLGVPEALFNPGAIRANVEAAQYQHQLGAVLPWLRKVDDTINGDFLPIYDDKIFVASEDPVVSDRVADAQVRTQYISAGVMSINDVRPELGLEPIDGGDEPLVNSMLAPLSEIVADPEPTPPQLAPFAGANNPPKPNDNEPDEVPGANEDEVESEKLAGMVLQKLKDRLFIHA